jgi:hypothetical protein
MAGVSYDGNELSPAPPAALHKPQHDWISVEDVGPAKFSSKASGVKLNAISEKPNGDITLTITIS